MQAENKVSTDLSHFTPYCRYPFVKGGVGVAIDLTLPVITLTLLGSNYPALSG
jgi:hypothetical protein